MSSLLGMSFRTAMQLSNSALSLPSTACRTIMDTFLNGWVQQQFTTNYNIIAAPAQKDNAKWNGGDPALGYKCALVIFPLLVIVWRCRVFLFASPRENPPPHNRWGPMIAIEGHGLCTCRPNHLRCWKQHHPVFDAGCNMIKTQPALCSPRRQFNPRFFSLTVCQCCRVLRRQMIEETLPIRKQQLYNTYGPGGSQPLIPAAQAAVPNITPGATGGTGDQVFSCPVLCGPCGFSSCCGGFLCCCRRSVAASITHLGSALPVAGLMSGKGPSLQALACRAEQSRAEQSRAEQSRAEQSACCQSTSATACAACQAGVPGAG